MIARSEVKHYDLSHDMAHISQNDYKKAAISLCYYNVTIFIYKISNNNHIIILGWECASIKGIINFDYALVVMNPGVNFTNIL